MKALLKERRDLKVFIVLDAPNHELGEHQQGLTDPMRHVNRFLRNPTPEQQDESFTIKAETLPDEWKKANDWARQFFADTAIAFLDPTPIVWPDGQCNLLHWYNDDDHFQPQRVEKEATWIDAAYGL